MIHLKTARSLLLAALLLPPAVRAQSGDGYRIGARDLIEIQVFEVPNLNVKRRVAADGTIDLPILGSLSVEGLSQSELTQRIKESLEENYLQRASVTVEVLENRSNPISVVGAVERPGTLRVASQVTLLEALTEAGGLTGETGRVIRITRVAQNGLSDQLEIPIDELLSPDSNRSNLPIFANDVINVSQESPLTVYFLGEVVAKGSLSFASSEAATVLRAIARAGGLTERASNKILIRRTARDGRVEEIELNYKRILDGKDPDIELQDKDLVVVKESFF